MNRKLLRPANVARTPRSRCFVLAALAACAVAAMFLAFPLAAPAQETVSIRGRVVNGTAGADVPTELTVLMLVTGPDGTLSGTGQTVMEPDGSFVLTDAPVVEDGAYNLSVDYGGIFFGRSLTPAQLIDEVTITVHEATEDARIIEVQRQVMVISDIDVAERVVTATEFVRFTNPTDRALRPNLETARPGMFSFMRFALPPNAADVTVQSNLRGGEIISVGSGFAIAAPVLPGQHSVDFAYTFPYEDGVLDYRNSLPQGAEIFQILVPEQWPDIEIVGLTARPAVGIGDEAYRAWEGRDLPAGPGVQLQFRGLPEPGVLSQVGRTFSGGGFWLTAVPVAVGVVLFVFLALGLARRYHPAAATGPFGAPGSDNGFVVSDSERAVLVSRLAALDDNYQQGGMEEDDYLARRAVLVDRALGESPEAEE